VFGELEATYGPYAHDDLLVYITKPGEMGSGVSGMEYAGATMTTMGALEHEITHSWFARGVMPANGNAGWIDEAIAKWRDLDYPRYSEPPGRVNLAGFSLYRRTTEQLAYQWGPILLGHLDHLIGGEGLRPVLRALYLAKRRQTITTPFFQQFLEERMGLDLGPLFDRSVYGVGEAPAVTAEGLREFLTEEEASPEPRAYSEQELLELL
jgi:hypothetical protein